jgi:hypothetical protein
MRIARLCSAREGIGTASAPSSTEVELAPTATVRGLGGTTTDDRLAVEDAPHPARAKMSVPATTIQQRRDTK